MSAIEWIILAKVIVWFVIIIGGGYLLIMKFLKSISKARGEEQAKEGEEQAKKMEKFRRELARNCLNDALISIKKFYSRAINFGSPGNDEKTPEQADYWKNYDLIVCKFGRTLIQLIIEEDSSQKFDDLKQNLRLLDEEIFVLEDTEKVFVLIDSEIKKMIEDNRTIDTIINHFKFTIDEHGFITHISGLTSFHFVHSFDSVFNTP